MSSKLKNLEVQEVSLVDQPANPGARIMILKALDKLKKAQTFDDIVGIDEIRQNLMSMTWAFTDSIWSILDDEDVDQKSLLSQTVTEFTAALNKMEITNMATKEQLKELGASDEVISLHEEEMTKSGEALTSLQATVETLKSEIETLKASKTEDDDTSDDLTPIDKSDLPEAVVKALEASDKRAKEAEDREKVNSDKIAKMESDAETSSFIAKAQDLDHLPMKAEDLGPIMKSMSNSLDKDDYEKFDQMLKGLNKQVSEGELFKSIGDDLGDDGDDMERVNKMAQDMVNAGDAKSIEAARGKLYKRDPSLRPN